MIANWLSNNSKVIAQIRGSPVTQLCNNGFVLRKRINYVDGFDVGTRKSSSNSPPGLRNPSCGGVLPSYARAATS
jgi:hypothetical protein